MKARIWKSAKVKDRPTLFKLEQIGDRVRLVVVNDVGDTVEGGNILQITHDGRVELFNHVNPKLGFELNSDGQVVTGSY